MVKFDDTKFVREIFELVDSCLCQEELDVIKDIVRQKKQALLKNKKLQYQDLEQFKGCW